MTMLAACLAGLATSDACNIPVFRYALERWRPDPFEVVVFHAGPLSDEQQAIVDRWRARSVEVLGREEPGQESANFELALADRSSELPRESAALWQLVVKNRTEPPSLPWVVFRAPGDPRKPLVAWSGPLADETFARASESPVRRELRQRLLAGHSIVWLVVPGRDAAENERLEKLFAEKLPNLEQEITLPEGIGTDGFDLLSEVPLEITFSTLTMSRDDMAEQTLLAMLAAHFPQLADGQKSVVLPVFGCGRVLDAIVGSEIDGDVLTDASQFLCGACSCQVKNLNPGVDLLMTGDWDALLELAGKPVETSATRGKPLTPPAEPRYVPIPGTPKSAASGGAGADSKVGPRTEVALASATPAISASTSPLPPQAAPVRNETFGMSRSDRDQAERWPLSVTVAMIGAGSVALVVMITRAIRRRRSRTELPIA